MISRTVTADISAKAPALTNLSLGILTERIVRGGDDVSTPDGCMRRKGKCMVFHLPLSQMDLLPEWQVCLVRWASKFLNIPTSGDEKLFGGADGDIYSVDETTGEANLFGLRASKTTNIDPKSHKIQVQVTSVAGPHNQESMTYKAPLTLGVGEFALPMRLASLPGLKAP